MKEKKKRRNRSFQLPFNSEKREAEGRTNARIRVESSINEAGSLFSELKGS